ncbi:MAG: DUF2079 domain-containing protein [Chloroflexota bacterium]|nr:DUF2079 domain-containing protein [Chloroflexota bacterium]
MSKAHSASHSRRPPRWAVALLWALIVIYTLYFSAVSIRLHDAHQTHASDLGQIDLAIWNTSQGRFVEQIKGDQITTRMTDHVEPIFAPVSTVFWIWDDVRALLILQAALLALGAWPVFHYAYDRVMDKESDSAGDAKWSALTALAFVAAYLLYPSLQAASAAEFHALPLATPLILFAFLFAQRRQWGRFAVAALLVATVQEGTALLAAALGAYALGIGIYRLIQGRGDASVSTDPVWHNSQVMRPLVTGAIVLAAGLLWFYLATFVIVPVYAAEAYGLDESPYVARYGALGSSFGDVITSLFTRPGTVLRIAMEPLRLRYLLLILAPLGFLSLIGFEILLVGLPLFLANFLSAFPFQYSGQLHYSTPLAAYVVIAAIVGAQRLRPAARQVAVIAGNRGLWTAYRKHFLLIGWILVWSIGCQILSGYTPIGSNFRQSWPAVTPHHRLLARFADQIPDEAALSTMPSLHPHLSHRERIYRFPVLADSQFVLLDIAARTGWSMHPEEMKRQAMDMLNSGEWMVEDAADGYLLLRRASGGQDTGPAGDLPPEFYSFARPRHEPQYPLDITFGDRVKLLGYDVLDDSEWRQTAIRLYWQALDSLPDDLQLRAFFMTPDGQEVDSSDQRPLIQPIWLPPSAWPVGETIVTDKLHWFLPREWALAAGVYQGNDWESNQRWTISAGQQKPGFDDNSWTIAGTYHRVNGQLQPSDGLTDLEPLDVAFGGDGWTTRLTGVSLPRRAAPGTSVPLSLQWQSNGPSMRDYTIFLHLRDVGGRTVAQADAGPTWYGPRPTSQWPADETLQSAHTLQLSPDLEPGLYDVVAGWYYWETMERLAKLGPDGQPVGDETVIAQLAVDSTAGPDPDLCCALVPECCASQ